MRPLPNGFERGKGAGGTRGNLRPIFPDEMRSAIRVYAAGLIETEDGKPLADDPDQPLKRVRDSRERALER